MLRPESCGGGGSHEGAGLGRHAHVGQCPSSAAGLHAPLAARCHPEPGQRQQALVLEQQLLSILQMGRPEGAPSTGDLVEGRAQGEERLEVGLESSERHVGGPVGLWDWSGGGGLDLLWVSWESLWLTCDLTLVGQLLRDADRRLWNRCDGDSRWNVRQRRLDLRLERSRGLDEVWLSHTSWCYDPCVERRCGVASLRLVGVHGVGQLLGYDHRRLKLWCCCRESNRSHWFLHVSPSYNLLGWNILSQSLWRALHGLWTGEVLCGRLVGLQCVRRLHSRSVPSFSL